MKTRTTLELLQLLYEEVRDIDLYSELLSGICLVISELEDNSCITREERDRLERYIHSHRPEHVKHLSTKRKAMYECWWEPGEVQPRLDFLQDLINNYNE